jgi:hypothetical protein
MTKLNLFVVLAFVGCVVSAEDRDQQRQSIDMVRKEKLTELAAQDAACLSRFATTDCQNLVGVRRREMLADLKRQEARLNEADRRQKSADQLQSSRDKATDRAQRQSEMQANQKADALAERQKAQEEKVLNHMSQAKTAAPVTPVNKTASGLDAAAVERKRAAFAEKQRSDEQRRLDREKRLLEKKNGSTPLPRNP